MFCTFHSFLISTVLITMSSTSPHRHRVFPDLDLPEDPSEDKSDQDSPKEADMLLELLMREPLPVRITVHGDIDFAHEAPTKLSEPSLLRVFIGPFHNDSRGVYGSPKYKVYGTARVDLTIYRPGTPLDYSTELKIPLDWLHTGVTYHIFALLNVGWSPVSDEPGGGESRPRAGDYLGTELFTLHEHVKDYGRNLKLKEYRPSGHDKHHELHHLDTGPAPAGLENTFRKGPKPNYFM